MSKRMRDLTGCKERVPWCRAEPLIANLHDKFALNHIEPFVLALRDVEWWATFRLPLGLEYRAYTTIILRLTLSSKRSTGRPQVVSVR